MFKQTKNDLSAKVAKLDMTALIAVAEQAVGMWQGTIQRLQDEIATERAKVRAGGWSGEVGKALIRIDSASDQLVNVTTSLAVAAECYHALIEARTRRDVLLINRPEIPMEGDINE